MLARHPQPLGEAVDRDHPLGAHQPRALLRHQAHAAAAPDRDRVARLDVAEIGAHVAGRRRIREKQRRLVRHPVGNLEAVIVGKRHAHVLRVRARVAAEGVGVAVDAGRRVAAEQRRLQLGLGMRVVAQRVEVVLAVPALAADDERGNDDAVALLHALHLGADLLDHAHELVADHVAGLHGGDVAVDEVEVRAAGRGQADAQDGVVRVDDLGVLHRADAQVVHAVPVERSHVLVSFSACRREQRAGARWSGSRRFRRGS